MLQKLSGVRRRVERLATEARSEGCGGDHQRLKIVFLDAGESAPAWPEAGAEKHCACGAELQFFQVVNSVRAGSPQ